MHREFHISKDLWTSNYHVELGGKKGTFYYLHDACDWINEQLSRYYKRIPNDDVVYDDPFRAVIDSDRPE